MTGNNSAGHAIDQVRDHGPQRARGGGGARRRDAARLRRGPGEPGRRAAAARRAWRRRCARSTRDNAEEIALRFPKVLRKVGGYNLETLGEPRPNLARLMVGSEGTLGFFTRIQLKLSRMPKHRVGAICHFARFYDAMDMTRFMVELGPTAVELVDRTMMDLARDIAAFRVDAREARQGRAGRDPARRIRGRRGRRRSSESVKRLEQLMADLGYPGAVVRIRIRRRRPT